MIKPLAKSVLISLGLTAAADAGIHKKILGSGNNRHSSSAPHITLIISNDEINGVIEIVKSLEDSGLSIKGVTETVQKNEVKEQKGGFVSASLCTFGASLLGDLLIGKGIYRAEKGKGIVKAGYSHPSQNSSNNKRHF